MRMKKGIISEYLKNRKFILLMKYWFLTDRGYVGFQTLHSNTAMPKKKVKRSRSQKLIQRVPKKLSNKRVLNTHVTGKNSPFKIVSFYYDSD